MTDEFPNDAPTVDIPPTSEGDFIRDKAHTVTTFNQMLEVVADAFDLHGVIGDDGDIDEPVAPEETRSRKAK